MSYFFCYMKIFSYVCQEKNPLYVGQTQKIFVWYYYCFRTLIIHTHAHSTFNWISLFEFALRFYSSFTPFSFLTFFLPLFLCFHSVIHSNSLCFCFCLVEILFLIFFMLLLVEPKQREWETQLSVLLLYRNFRNSITCTQRIMVIMDLIQQLNCNRMKTNIFFPVFYRNINNKFLYFFLFAFWDNIKPISLVLNWTNKQKWINWKICVIFLNISSLFFWKNRNQWITALTTPHFTLQNEKWFNRTEIIKTIQ